MAPFEFKVSEHWIRLGLPDERHIRKGCNRAKRVTVYAYGERSASIWWKNIEADLRCLNNSRFDNLTVNYLSPEDASAIAAMAERNMSLQATVQEGDI